MKNLNTSDKVPRSGIHKETSLDTGWILVHQEITIKTDVNSLHNIFYCN